MIVASDVAIEEPGDDATAWAYSEHVSPCAPTIEISNEISTNAGLFLARMVFGSAPGKHFLQNQVGVPDTQRGPSRPRPDRGKAQSPRPHGRGDQDGGELSGAPTDAPAIIEFAPRTIPSRASEPNERDLIATALRPSTIPQRLWDLGTQSRPAHLRFFSQKKMKSRHRVPFAQKLDHGFAAVEIG